MSERRYRAIYRKDGKFIFASTPDLPGAFGQGSTVEQAREDLRAAILLMLDVIEEEAWEGGDTPLLEEELVIATA